MFCLHKTWKFDLVDNWFLSTEWKFLTLIWYMRLLLIQPIPVAARFTACVPGHLLAGIAFSNATRSMDVWCLSVVIYVFCQDEVSVTSRSHVQSSPAECGVSECHRGTSQKSLWPTRPVESREKFILLSLIFLMTVLILISIYLLTTIGLTAGGSSTVHIYTQTIHRTTQLTTLDGRLSGIRTQSGQIKINDELTA
jgi:hypothetical protein